jgi:indole-3-glycerol phosphate synthase
MNARFLARLRPAEGRPGGALIAEIKVRSGSGEELLRSRDVAGIVQKYEAAGAACLSVVTGPWFGGSPQLLRAVVEAATLPVLQKDFFSSRIAVAQAAKQGASAVLLTRQILSVRSLFALAEYAESLGLTPFVEVNSSAELADLRLSKNAVLAVNNRDIATRETSGEGAARGLVLCETARAMHARALANCSGIDSPEEARRLIECGFDALS